MLCSQNCCALSLELHRSIPKVHADASCHSISDILRTLTCAGAGTPENKGDRKRMRPALLKTCTLDTHTPPAASHADVEMQYVKPSLHLPQHAVDLCKLCAIREQFCCSICKHQAVCTSSWTYSILRLSVCLFVSKPLQPLYSLCQQLLMLSAQIAYGPISLHPHANCSPAFWPAVLHSK